jgi:hypothetical protein
LKEEEDNEEEEELKSEIIVARNILLETFLNYLLM